ncbi:hypothetical protein BH23PAT1_BH23PAT1_2490 [soil metagenome]
MVGIETDIYGNNKSGHADIPGESALARVGRVGQLSLEALRGAETETFEQIGTTFPIPDLPSEDKINLQELTSIE